MHLVYKLFGKDTRHHHGQPPDGVERRSQERLEAQLSSLQETAEQLVSEIRKVNRGESGRSH